MRATRTPPRVLNLEEVPVSTFDSVSPAALVQAIALVGAPAVRLRVAAQRLDWPCLSRAALHNRLVAGTLPVPARKLGGRWFIYAADLAAQLTDPSAFGRLGVRTDSAPAPAHNGPGRPRKRAGGAP
jgi:hypothetical protein